MAGFPKQEKSVTPPAEDDFDDECDGDHTNPRGGCGCC